MKSQRLARPACVSVKTVPTAPHLWAKTSTGLSMGISQLSSSWLCGTGNILVLQLLCTLLISNKWAHGDLWCATKFGLHYEWKVSNQGQINPSERMLLVKHIFLRNLQSIVWSTQCCIQCPFEPQDLVACHSQCSMACELELFWIALCINAKGEYRNMTTFTADSFPKARS